MPEPHHYLAHYMAIQAHKSKYVIELLKLKHKMDIHLKDKAETQFLKVRPIRTRIQ